MKGLKRLRTKKGLNQNELGEMAGITAPAISRYENGTRYPNVKLLRKLASLLDCSVDELVTEDNSDPEDEKGATP